MYQSQSNYTVSKLVSVFQRYYERPADGQIREAAGKLATELVCKSYRFPQPRQIQKNGKNVVFFSDWRANVILRNIDSQLRSGYGIHFPDRIEIVRQLIRLVDERAFAEVIRTDVKGFFESISYELVLQQIREDRRVCNQTLSLLFRLKEMLPATMKGLPRGLPIASTMSEMFMGEIDRTIRSVPGVYFYMRYVDDIVLLSYGPRGSVLKEIAAAMTEHGLVLNSEKTEVVASGSQDRLEISYLGYTLSASFIQKKAPITVSISQEKVKKIKSRIISALLAFGRDRDFSLLKDRIHFLADASPVFSKGRIQGALRRGLFFNYNLINEVDALKELDSFKAAAIYSNRPGFSRKASLHLSGEQKRILASISFLRGYEQKRRKSFSGHRMTKIMEAFQ